MKKILFTLLMSLTSLAHSQSTDIVYLRTYNLSVGVRESINHEITWVRNAESVNILIELHPTKGIVYSAETQIYYVINAESKTPLKWVWRCKNDKGLTCFLTIELDPKYPDLALFKVEFDDVVWFYVCRKE